MITIAVVQAGTSHAVRQNMGASVLNTFSLALENSRSIKGADITSSARFSRVLVGEVKSIPG